VTSSVVLLAGASGLVGGHVLARLLAKPRGPRVLAPVRRALATTHPRLDAVVADLGSAGKDADLQKRLRSHSAKVDLFVCCLGTTLKAAGSREAFVAVDRELVLRMAAIARDLGARRAVLVSSVGASAQSGNFYLRVKGETERGVAALGFDRVDLLRPGLLLGERGESRPAERLARAAAPVFNVLLPGRLERYRAISADTVAAAAVALLSVRGKGTHVHEYASLVALTRGD
jgi:uncharacterized protein YbjT (DUF2867 family)